MHKVVSCALMVGYLGMGCSAGDVGESVVGEDIEPGAVQQPIRNADGPGDAGFALGLTITFEEAGSTNTKTGSCTGVALTPHWILTSAHCLRLSLDGKEYRARRVRAYRQPYFDQYDKQEIYNGRVGYKVPKNWDPMTLNPEDSDIGLMKLAEGTMSPSPHEWGRIYDDSLWDLWYEVDGEFTATGWGLGNTNTTSCSLSSLKPRTGRVSTWGLTGSMTLGYQDLGTNLCEGDSGGPWWGQPSGSRYKLTWGITSRGPKFDCSYQCVGTNEIVAAVYPGVWLDWIEAASTEARLPLDCRRYTSGGWSYQRCYE